MKGEIICISVWYFLIRVLGRRKSGVRWVNDRGQREKVKKTNINNNGGLGSKINYNSLHQHNNLYFSKEIITSI